MFSCLPATTDGPAATQALGARLAAELPPGSVVALVGDLGAGKTHLAKGVAQGLGLDPDEVTSPTFTLVQEYAEAGLVHLDLYRLERPGEVDALGLDDILEAFDVALVEWPERAFGRLPAGTVWLHLEHLGGDRRRIALADAPSSDREGTPSETRSPLVGERPGEGAPSSGASGGDERKPTAHRSDGPDRRRLAHGDPESPDRSPGRARSGRTRGERGAAAETGAPDASGAPRSGTPSSGAS